MNETPVTVVGNVATEPRAHPTPTGVDMVTFRVASTIRRYDRTTGAWADSHTNWVGVVCWRALARNVLASLHKGQPVVVTGTLQLKQWEKDGRTGVNAEIDAAHVGHDLSRGTAVFARAHREASPPVDQAASPSAESAAAA